MICCTTPTADQNKEDGNRFALSAFKPLRRFGTMRWSTPIRLRRTASGEPDASGAQLKRWTKNMKTTTTLLLLIAFSVSAFADAWNDSDVFFETVYTQTDSSGSHLHSTTPVAFRASARNAFSDQQQSLILPLSSPFTPNPILSFQRIGAHHVFFQGAASFANLSALFPAGGYNWSISGSNSGGLINVSTAAQPSSSIGFQPQIINGNWSNGKLRLLATNPQFQIASWTSPPTGSRIEFELWRAGGAGGSSMGPTTTTVSWLPQPVGSVFSAYLSFRVIDSQTQVTTSGGTTFNSRNGRASTLYFEIEMVDSLSQPGQTPSVQISAVAGGIQLSWLTEATKQYQVQWSPDLISWSNLGNSISGDGLVKTVSENLGANTKRFYRVIISPVVNGGENPQILEAAVGSWSWFDGGIVALRQDGTFGRNGAVDGTWKQIGDRLIELSWYGGIYIDTLTLSQDNNTLSGSNGDGTIVSATRTNSNPAPTELIIIDARYGANGVTSDVRSYVAANIQNNAVSMTVGNHTLGGDPIFGVTKNLYIRYQNTSGIYEANIREGSTLNIPDAGHTKIQ